MNLTRRAFLQTGAAGALAAADLFGRERLASARGLLTDPLLEKVIDQALASAKRAGATYADIRIVRNRDESVRARDDHLESVGYSERYGFGVRVIAGGAWGFAASSNVDPKEAGHVAERAVAIARAHAALQKKPVELAPTSAAVDVWQTALTKDPFKIPIEDKVELLLAINRTALKVKGVKYVSSSFSGLGEWKLFASSEGSTIEQNITRVGPRYVVTAVDSAKGEFVERAHELPPMQAGWEYVETAALVEDAHRIGEEAVEKLKAPQVVAGKHDLILAPSNLWLTIHESIGHATELDRALGYEANFAGTSHATPDKLNKLRFGSRIVNVFADKISPGGLATAGYDDDGVKAQRWDLIKDGMFVGYQTTREQAGWIGEKASRGTCYADSFRSFPFQRMPNVSLAAGEKDLKLADLISATQDGVYITGNGSWSIDHQRFNFQFGGQMFYEIKGGKITHALKDVAYQANAIAFWNACDMIAGRTEWRLNGSLSDGKGEPGQANSVSHGCPPARFRQIDILNTNRRNTPRTA